MANLDITSPVDFATLDAIDANLQRQIWSTNVTVWDQSEDDWTWAVGDSEDNVVWWANDPKKGAGEVVHFTNMGGFYHLAHHGDTAFSASTDWEKVNMGTYSVTVDEVRNGVRHTDRLEYQLGVVGELKSKFTKLLGQWAGREKSEQMHMSFLEQCLGENLVFSNNKKSYNDLRLQDGVTWNNIVNAGAYLSSWVAPARTGTDREGNEIKQYCVFGASPSYKSLKDDPTFQNLVKDADLRGDANSAFTGKWLSVQGHFLKEFTPLDHDRGMMGSPVNPRAKLGVAITSGTTTFNLKGGGVNDATVYNDPLAGWFRWFPGYAYQFRTDFIVDPSSYTGNVPLNAPKYVMVYVWTGANAGKKMFLSYSAHATYGLTISGILGSTTSGIKATTLGNVTYNADKNCEEAPVGSLIIPCNSSGVPIGHTYFFGKGAGLRAKGQYYNKRVEDPAFDLGKILGVGTTSVYGQTARKDLSGRRHFAVMAHAIRYAGMDLDLDLVTP